MLESIWDKSVWC